MKSLQLQLLTGRASRLAAALLVSILAGWAPGSAANTIYKYSGPGFISTEDGSLPVGAYDSSMNISGWIELGSPLPALVTFADLVSPVAFSFSDGRGALADALGSFKFQTDLSGSIIAWMVGVSEPPIGSGVQASLGTYYLPDQALSGFDSASRSYYSGGKFVSQDSASTLALRTEQQHGAWTLASPVPEATTLNTMLAGMGLLVLMVIRRRRFGPS